MRDYVWPRCPSGWNGEERQFFRALIELLQQMGQPITEKDLSPKLLELIQNGIKQEDNKQEETPDDPFVEIYDLFDNGYANDILWTGNVLKRPANTGAGTYSFNSVSSGFMQVGIIATTNQVPISHNAHLITSPEIEIPENATKIKIECQRYCASENDTTPINMQFGILPSNAPGAYNTNNGGLLSDKIAVSNELTVYEMTLNVRGKYKVIINAEGNTGIKNGLSIPARYIRVYKVWFE